MHVLLVRLCGCEKDKRSFYVGVDSICGVVVYRPPNICVYCALRLIFLSVPPCFAAAAAAVVVWSCARVCVCVRARAHTYMMSIIYYTTANISNLTLPNIAMR